MKQQVLRRISADGEFRKDDEIGLQLIACARYIVQDLFRISSDIADEKIELGQCDVDGFVQCVNRRCEQVRTATGCTRSSVAK